MRTSSIVCLTAFAVGCFMVGPTAAQPYPVKPVRIVTGSVGALPDIMARRVAQGLTEIWKQPVIVDNRPGAGLSIAATIAAKSAPDGYTLLMGDRTSHTVSPLLYKSASYDALRDFAPITLVASTPLLLVAHPSVPAANLREFIEHARHASKGYGYATAGGATSTHLAGELLCQVAGVPLVPIHYKGGGAAMSAIVAGETKAGFNPPLLAIPHINAGKAKAYITTGRNRLAGAPDLPTVAEAGLAALESEYWIAMFAPAGTAEPLIAKLNRDVAAILRAPAARETLRAQGAESLPGTPDELSRFIRSETARWRKVVETAGIRVE